MKLLLDANISWRLTAVLAEHFGVCAHVNRIDLPLPAKDSTIWDYAAEHGYIIVTQDSDFLHLLETKGYPPKVILLRTGNISRTTTETILLQARAAIEALDTNNYGLLEIL
jgi:predicted nuclease of predicted toxin-antitoxin system